MTRLTVPSVACADTTSLGESSPADRRRYYHAHEQDEADSGWTGFELTVIWRQAENVFVVIGYRRTYQGYLMIFGTCICNQHWHPSEQ